MTTKYFALLTNQGAAKLANAAALGTKVNITSLAVGDGGGTLPTPDPAQTKLIGEKRRAQLNSLSVDAANSSQIIAEQIIPESEGGFWIREIGLYDADGVLLAVANCAETYKPQLAEGSGRTQTVRMIIIVNSTSAVTLKIDPAVVLATRQYVDNAVIEVKQYADKLMADHLQAKNPHGQYLQTKNALSEIKEAGLVPDLLENLGLSESFSGRLLRRSVIRVSGKWKKTPGAKSACVIVVGGGGGGGAAQANSAGYVSAGSGGGAGGAARKALSLESIDEIDIVIGLGGAGGIYSSNQPSGGGTTKFGNILSAGGGGRGNNGGSVAFGATQLIANGGGGVGIGGDENITGGSGSQAIVLGTGYTSGGGGNSILSGGGQPISTTQSLAGVDGAYGSGGSGGYVLAGESERSGGRGGDGVVIIEEYA